MKRIAVCVSGCPRSWEVGLSSHQGFFEECQKRWRDKVQLVYFMVFWDFRCPSINFERYELLREKYDYVGDAREFVFPVDLKEQEEIGQKYRPAYIEFKTIQEMKQQDQEEWLYPGAYLMKEVLRQRRIYEARTRRFDLCLWCRSDVIVEANKDTNLPKNPKGLVGDYLYRSGKILTHIGFRDLFFYGQPGTVDLAASIYPQGVLPRSDIVYTDADFIEEEFYKNLNHWGIFTESFGSFDLDISRQFEEDLLSDEKSALI